MNKDLIGSNCLGMQFELLDGMFFDNKKETDNYVLQKQWIIIFGI